jgi:5-methylcytosine-specific restriction protein A
VHEEARGSAARTHCDKAVLVKGEKVATYLLAWNPKRWHWDDLPDRVREIEDKGSTLRRWSCGGSTQIRQGDRLFLIRLGEEPKGILASGEAVSDWYEGSHWDADKARSGETTHYVDVTFDALFDPSEEPILPRHFLNEPPFSDQHWDTQSSGIRIHDHVAAALEEEWAQYLVLETPQEILQVGTFVEGSTKQITVNSYERSRRAAKHCVDRYGHACSVCSFNFAQTYGEVGEGFIHVHHLKPLSQVGSGYRVDPIQDLRPVCPNCHAMIHRRDPPYGIDELKGLLD